MTFPTASLRASLAPLAVCLALVALSACDSDPVGPRTPNLSIQPPDRTPNGLDATCQGSASRFCTIGHGSSDSTFVDPLTMRCSCTDSTKF